jgi:hypothetical protein
MTATASVRCGACGYTTEVKTYEDELAQARREVLELATDLREMTQQRDDLKAELDGIKSAAMRAVIPGLLNEAPLDPAVTDITSSVGPAEDDIS